MPCKATDLKLTKEDLEEIIREKLENFIYEDVATSKKQDMPDTLLRRKPNPLKIEDQPEDYTQRPIGLRSTSTAPKKSTLQHARSAAPIGITVGGKQIALNKGTRWKSLGAESPKYALSLTGKFGGEKGITLEQIIKEELEKLLHEQAI
jgi:hypothetical protein